MNIKNLEDILACPNCRDELHFINSSGGKKLALLCKSCKLVYPIKEDILIILPNEARNYELEYDLIKNIYEDANHSKIEKECIENTLSLLNSTKSKSKSWEWEDESYWSKEYKKRKEQKIKKNWNDRLWQREFLIESLLNQTSLDDLNVLSVGCGEGQNFRSLISNYCSADTLYLATDISFIGLKLNKSQNKHDKSGYIVCSAENLPIQKESIDILCYFGILHHTKSKHRLLIQHEKLLRLGGFMLIHEALDSKNISDFLPSLSLSKE